MVGRHATPAHPPLCPLPPHPPAACTCHHPTCLPPPLACLPAPPPALYLPACHYPLCRPTNPPPHLPAQDRCGDSDGGVVDLPASPLPPCPCPPPAHSVLPFPYSRCRAPCAWFHPFLPRTLVVWCWTVDDGGHLPRGWFWFVVTLTACYPRDCLIPGVVVLVTYGTMMQVAPTPLYTRCARRARPLPLHFRATPAQRLPRVVRTVRLLLLNLPDLPLPEPALFGWDDRTCIDLALWWLTPPSPCPRRLPLPPCPARCHPLPVDATGALPLPQRAHRAAPTFSL